jgi:hypothetical protein
MPTDIQQLRRQNSYRAVIGGKGLVQLGHFAADAGILFHQMDPDAHLTQVQSGLHARYPAAYYENFLRGHYATIHELFLPAPDSPRGEKRKKSDNQALC